MAKLRSYLFIKQDVSDDLSFEVMKLLPDISTLTSLVTISIVKVEMEISNCQWPQVGHLIKGSCGFKGGCLSQQVTTQPSLVLIDIALLEI